MPQLEVLGNPLNLPSNPNIPKRWIISENDAEIRIAWPSSTDSSKEYTLLVLKLDNSIHCNCKGYQHHFHCKHIRRFLEAIKEVKKPKKGVSDTSRESYHKTDINKGQSAVLATLQLLGPATGRELARNLGWSINRVTGRVRELVEAGKVEEQSEKTFDKETKRSVSIWQAVGGYHGD